MNEETLQQGVHLYFYCHQREKHGGVLLSEWLLSQSRELGIGGGSVFRAIAGFGRHGVMHEQQFFELADDVTVRVDFLLTDELAERLLQRVREANPELVYARSSTTFAQLGNR